MDTQAQVKELIAWKEKSIADARERFKQKGLFDVPYGVGWGLGSQGEYLMNFCYIPAIMKEFNKSAQEIMATNTQGRK